MNHQYLHVHFIPLFVGSKIQCKYIMLVRKYVCTIRKCEFIKPQNVSVNVVRLFFCFFWLCFFPANIFYRRAVHVCTHTCGIKSWVFINMLSVKSAKNIIMFSETLLNHKYEVVQLCFKLTTHLMHSLTVTDAFSIIYHRCTGTC